MGMEGHRAHQETVINHIVMIPVISTNEEIVTPPATNTDEGIVTLIYENGRAQRPQLANCNECIEISLVSLCALPFSYSSVTISSFVLVAGHVAIVKPVKKDQKKITKR